MQILILSPHPDDDVIAMGGTIAKHIAGGDHVVTIYMTSGEAGIDDTLLPVSGATRREDEAGLASQILHTHALHFLRQPDGALDWSDEVTRNKLYDITRNLTIDRVYAPHLGEDHRDHIHTAVITRDFFIDTSIWYYEVWTPIAPSNEGSITYIDITPYAQEKHAAISAHESQRSSNFAEAALSLNRYRGIMSGLHYYFAEAFLVVK